MTRHWFDDPIPALDAEVLAAARVRQTQLTKPPGSLGRLEELGVTLAAMQGQQHPHLDKVWISIFAADHGVVAENISFLPFN